MSGQTPLSSLEGYEFPSNGIVYMDSGAATRTAPIFDDAHKTGTVHKSGNNVHYVAKTNGDNRMWVKFTDGNYMPIGQLDTLPSHTPYDNDFNGTRFHEQVGSFTIKTTNSRGRMFGHTSKTRPPLTGIVLKTPAALKRNPLTQVLHHLTMSKASWKHSMIKLTTRQTSTTGH